MKQGLYSVLLAVVLSACGSGNAPTAVNGQSLGGAFVPVQKSCACPCANADACNAMNWQGYYSKVECVTNSGIHVLPNSVNTCSVL